MSNASLIPHLVCRNASTAIDFYARALGAERQMVVQAPDGKLMHACLRINGSELYLCDECPEQGAMAPATPGAGSVTLHLTVPDCDAVFQRAIEAGCEARMPPQDMFWGDRYGQFVDPYGHTWSVATPLREMSEAEIIEAMNAAICTA